MSPQHSRPSSRAKTSFSLDAELLQRVRDASWAERRSVTAYVENALREYLDRHPPPPMPQPSTEGPSPE